MNRILSKKSRLGAVAIALGLALAGAVAGPAAAETEVLSGGFSTAAVTTEIVRSGLTGNGTYSDPTPHYHATGPLSIKFNWGTACGNNATMALRKNPNPGPSISNSFNFGTLSGGTFRNIDGPPYTYTWAGGAVWFNSNQTAVQPDCSSNWEGVLTKTI